MCNKESCIAPSLNAGAVVGGLVDVAVEDLGGELVPQGAVGAPQFLHRRPEAEQVVLALVLKFGVGSILNPINLGSSSEIN